MDRRDNMSDYLQNEKKELKLSKIKIVLKRTMLMQLTYKKFSNISVRNLCEEALISRSTFYVYFKDKFDLLKYCMDDLKDNFAQFSKNHSDKEIVNKINKYIYENQNLLKNLMDDNNAEVMLLLIDLLSPNLDNILSLKEKKDNEFSLSHVILINFCAGGMANLLLWQIRNNFPIDEKLMSNYLYKMQKGIEKLDLEC